MTIPRNIKREHLLQAIDEIDREGISPSADSQKYDVLFGGKRYPPKLVVSIANKFANDEILDRRTFSGGVRSSCFRLLKAEGFEIVKKDDRSENGNVSDTRVWFVCQGSTFTEDRGKRFLWAPKLDSSGRPRFFWDNLKKVQMGDLIFNYSNGVRGVSVAVSDAFESQNTQEDSQWGPEGYQVNIELYEFPQEIPSSELVAHRKELKKALESVDKKPFNRNGGVNQGYLFEFTRKAGFLIRQILGAPFPNDEIDAFFASEVSDPDDLMPNHEKELVHKCLAMKTKPFVIFAGLSGSGKSHLARRFAYLFDNMMADRKEDRHPPSNFQLIKVKPNWHDSTEVLGYESRISGKDRYISSEFLRFIVRAWQHPQTPFFLCLDEMNLAPVEQYFAEYLSVIESRRMNANGIIETDALIDGGVFRKYVSNSEVVEAGYDIWADLGVENETLKNSIQDRGLRIPANLIVIGTVNMDETTHSFSRKVLDRAMTIEMSEIDLSSGLDSNSNGWSYPPLPYDPSQVLAKVSQGIEIYEKLGNHGNLVINYLNGVNEILESTPFRIAYRVRDEFLLYVFNYFSLKAKSESWFDDALDELTKMKILPRIEGDYDQTKLLEELITYFDENKLERSSLKAKEMNERRLTNHYTSFWS